MLHGTVADELAVMGALLGYVSPPVVIYLLAAGVMDAHRVLVNDRIMAAHEAARLAAAAEGGGPAQIPVAPGKGA